MENGGHRSTSQSSNGTTGTLILGVGGGVLAGGFGAGGATDAPPRSSGATGSTNKQLFDVFPHGSPAMGAGFGFPFTVSQWKELERQATIYKYMISSLPVPPELVHSISRNVDTESLDPLRRRDLEPGRCKRTDGKKWRCSRDVAPHQKYCERHIHRGRPRSRKPVETKSTANNIKKPRVDQPASLNEVSALPPTPANRKLEPRVENNLVEQQQQQQPWQNLMETSNLLFGVQQQPPHFSSNFPVPEMGIRSMDMDLLSSNNLLYSSSSRSFINPEDRSTSLELSIAMAVGDSLDEQAMNIQPFRDDAYEPRGSEWCRPVSWELMVGGGPLAEALKMGPSPGSPHESSIATTVSSPSGVLQRALFSGSDGSVCNSPTFAAAAHRLN